MQILISFCNQPAEAIANNLLLLDTKSGKKEYLLETRDSFTGLAQDQDFFYALSQNSDTGIVIINKKSGEIVLQKKIEGLAEAHSIAVDGNFIYAVSTGRDRVLQYKFDRENYRITLEKTLWKPDSSSGESDTHHINSIFLHKNELHVSAFGPRKSDRWSSAMDGYIFNLTQNKKAVLNIYHPHSVQVKKSLFFKLNFFYCESSSRSVWRNKQKIVVLESGYTRGLAISGRHLLLGTSSGRKVSRNNNLINNPADPGDLENDCRVILFHKNLLGKYGQEKEFSFLPGHKEIYDILIIKDEANMALINFYRKNLKQYIPQFIFKKIVNPIIDACSNKLRPEVVRPSEISIPEKDEAEMKNNFIKFPESNLAHKYLDGMSGLEIGGSAHNQFGLKTRNVDFTEDVTIYKQYELDFVGEMLPIDILAPGDNIPVPDESEDFIISSHVLEHFPDPIKALKEWYRIIRPGGYVYMIIPHKERTFDKDRPRTTIQELIDRHNGQLVPKANSDDHFSVWITEDVVELIKYLGWNIVEVQDIDDKVGNGFAIVIQK